MTNIWYVCDFFVRNKEAVSNQIELLSGHNNGTIIAAKRFMGQRVLRRSDIKHNIYVLPVLLYKILLPAVLLSNAKPIHYFEEEPSLGKRIVFNMRKRPLFISMYRRPTAEYARHLKKYRNLKKVFVELDSHRDILIREGISPELVAVSHPPAKIPRARSSKTYDPKDVVIVFASWNNKEKNALHERGLLYLLDLLTVNPQLKLEIPLRDSKINEFQNEVETRGLASRVTLLDINSAQELIEMYDRADLVAFVPQARISKDVPNSLLDGLMRGKPVLISTAIDFHHIVEKYALGKVIPVGVSTGAFHLGAHEYQKLSDNAYKYTERHTPEKYLSISKHYGAGS